MSITELQRVIGNWYSVIGGIPEISLRTMRNPFASFVFNGSRH
jgi:hypothetical protein